MPCAPGMTGCRLDCAHRRFVNDYVRDRDAQRIRAENATAGHEAELADYYGATGRPVEKKLVYKDHLTTHAGQDYPYPRIKPSEADEAAA